MKRVAVIAVVLFGLAAAPGAGAHTTIIEPVGSRFPYQEWIDESLVPTPDVTIEVIAITEGKCPPVIGWHSVCAVLEEHRIWIDEAQVARAYPRSAFMYEIGRIFDVEELPDWARRRYMRLYGFTDPWVAGPNKNFADSYAGCSTFPYLTVARSHKPGMGPLFGSDPLLGRRVTYNRVCRMLRNL